MPAGLCPADGQQIGVTCLFSRLPKLKEKCSLWQAEVIRREMSETLQRKTDVHVPSSATALGAEDHSWLSLQCRKPFSSLKWSINHNFSFISLLQTRHSVIFSCCYSVVKICRQNRKNLNQPKYPVGPSFCCWVPCTSAGILAGIPETWGHILH